MEFDKPGIAHVLLEGDGGQGGEVANKGVILQTGGALPQVHLTFHF